MKKNKGFTLVELLAVITIMGILMIVAIGSVNRIIDNSRRDSFATTAKEYVNTIRNEVLADNISCNSVTASATADGTYYFVIDTEEQNTKDLMESGGKSPYGNARMTGYVKWVKKTDSLGRTTTKYKIALTDVGNHGFKNELIESDLKRVNISTATGGQAPSAPTAVSGEGTPVKCVLS